MLFTHPVLGGLYHEDGDWCVDEATVPFQTSRIYVRLAGGNESAPSGSAIAGFDRISENWEQVLRLVEQQAFNFYQPYADAVNTVPKFERPSELWGTEKVVGLTVFAVDDFEVTLRFDWQEPADPHCVTFYVEAGICNSHTVDG